MRVRRCPAFARKAAEMYQMDWQFNARLEMIPARQRVAAVNAASVAGVPGWRGFDRSAARLCPITEAHRNNRVWIEVD